MYCSRKAGDTVNAAAMLLKPSTAMSAGRYWLGSISTARRSSTALAYSVRFKRWTGTRPAKVRLAAFVERGLEPANQRVDVLLRGLVDAGRRHLAPAQFAHNFFEDLGVFGYRLGAKLVQKEVSGTNFLVMATEAVEANS